MLAAKRGRVNEIAQAGVELRNKAAKGCARDFERVK